VQIPTIVTKMDAESSEKNLVNKIEKSFGLAQRTFIFSGQQWF
jgi:hypothetical protein